MVGAAPTGKHRTRGQLVRYLTGVGYQGRIYPVNPSYAEVDAIPCYPSLADIGQPIDVAVLALPADLIPDELEKCAQAGVKYAVVLSAGFIEAGTQGAQLQERMLEVSRRTGVRVVGPNCQGIYNIPGKVTTTFSPTVAPGAAGAHAATSGRRVGIIAQSGGIGYSLFARGRAAGLAFSYVVSTGNEVDLTTSDFLDYMIEDDRCDVVMLFCEAIRDPERFVAALAKAKERGKPVIALKVGKSQAAQRAAQSHTAALTGWDTGYRAVFDRYDVVQAEHPDEAVALAGVFATCPIPRGRRAGVITVSGGGGALMADMLAANGISLPQLSAPVQSAIRAYISPSGSTLNPVDLTLNSADLVMPTIELLEKSAEVDIIVLVTQLASGEILPIEPVQLRAIVDRQAKPIVAWTYTLPSAAGAKAASDGGLFLHPDLRNCGRAIGKLVEYAHARSPFITAADHEPEQAPGDARAIVTEIETKRVLATYGLPPAREELALNAAEAVAIAARLGGPVALKIQSPDLPHKTEAGGVQLGLQGTAAVTHAFDQILSAARGYRADARIDGILVQAMAPKGHEIVVGMVNDPTFGPIMMVGLGGIAIELFGDVVHRPAPVSATEAARMLQSLKSSALFNGFRGAAPLDLQPVADFIALASRIAVDHRGRIAEMEFNPVILHIDGSGVTIADALMILKHGVDPQTAWRQA